MTDRALFGKASRLLKAADYKTVFDNVTTKVSSKEYLCLIKENGLGYPRIGLIVAKKNIRLAVQRNRLKRIIRESFRLNQHQLPAIDMIILVRQDLGKLGNNELHPLFNGLWPKVIKKFGLFTTGVDQ